MILANHINQSICIPTSTHILTLSGAWTTTLPAVKAAYQTNIHESKTYTTEIAHILTATVSSDQSYTKSTTAKDGKPTTVTRPITVAYITIDNTIYELPTGKNAIIFAVTETKTSSSVEGGATTMARFKRGAGRWIGARRALGVVG